MSSARHLARRAARALLGKRAELEAAAEGASQVAGVVRVLAETVEDGARRVREVLRRAPEGAAKEWEQTG